MEKKVQCELRESKGRLREPKVRFRESKVTFVGGSEDLKRAFEKDKASLRVS